MQSSSVGAVSGFTTSTYESGGIVPCDPNGDVRRLCEKGRLKEAIHILNAMDQQGIIVNPDTYVHLLQGCTNIKDLTEGKRVHDCILRNGFKSNMFLGNTLVNMYSKCGSVVDARQVFDKMPERNVFTWTIMITGYAQHGYAGDAIELFRRMEWEGVKPDKVTFVSVLKACASLAALELGKKIHAQVIKMGFELDVFVGSALVDMYSKSGSIDHARQVFNKMPKRNVVSWNTMITGYAQHGHGKEALELFQQMESGGMKPNKVTFVSMLKSCASLAALEQGKAIHAQIIKYGFELEVSVGSTIVDMYGKCGSIEHARQVFDKMPYRNVVSWNAMIAGYAQQGYGEKALELFQQMKQEGVKPDEVTFVNILKACTSLLALEWGRHIHADIIRSGFELDVFVGSTLVDMYGKCGSIELARRVFDRVPKLSVVPWNAMITGYAQHDHGEEALLLFWEMERHGVKPDEITFVSILKACTDPATFEQGKQIHANIIERGFESNVFVGNTLVDMYSKCGSVENARRVFDNMPARNVISWTAIIAGYVQHGHAEMAFKLFRQMEREGVKANEVTFVSILKACASVAALKQGRRIHGHIIQSGFESDVYVGSALVDMYGKCGSIEHARQVFDKMLKRDVVPWNAMIAGYAQHGHGEEALQLVDQMKREGVRLNNITIICILSACSHAGLVNEGRYCFDSMNCNHGITPTVEHYACMVDLLARAGHLQETMDLIERMPFQPSAVLWTALLGACRVHGNVELAKRAAECVLKLEPHNATAFVLLSNVYAVAGRWDDKTRVRTSMEKTGLLKKPGLSHIEVNDRVHVFVVEDTLHPQIKEIHAELKRLSSQMEQAGYVPDRRFLLCSVEEEQKELSLCHHSESLAIVFGLISTPPGTSIRIVKNLLVCVNCHAATKFISKLVGREIIIRDANRFHHFEDGVCSCGEYW